MKKILAILLAAAMAFSLMACSGSEEEQAADSQKPAAETTNQKTDPAGDAKTLSQVSLKDLPATKLEPVPSAKCQVTADFNGTELAGQISISHVGFIHGQFSNEDVFVFDNPTDYDVALELRLYPLDANGQRGQSYSRLITSMQPQTTILVTSASLGFIQTEGAYDMELTVTEVPESDRKAKLSDQISCVCTAMAGKAGLTVENRSTDNLNVRITTLLLQDGAVVYLDANRSLAVAAGQTEAAAFPTAAEYNAFAVACLAEAG